MSQPREQWVVGACALLLVACTEPTGPKAVQLAFTVGPGNATAGKAIGPVVVVEIEDASGFTVTRATNVVTLTVVASPAGGTKGASVSASAVNGAASFPSLHIDKAGTGYTLSATANGLLGATSTPFNVTAGAATKLVFVVQPANTMGGAAATPPVQVAAQDSFGNTATGFRDSVTVALAGTPAAATLSGTTVAPAFDGVATFSDLSIAQVNAGYALIASARGLAGVSSAPFNITPPMGYLSVRAATTGTAPDPDGYGACIDPVSDGQGGTTCAYAGPAAIPVNGGGAVTVDTGAHAVLLTGLARNCAVTGDNPRSVHATTGQTVILSFAVACVPLTLHVTTTTTGDSLDADGYFLCMDYTPPSYDYYGNTSGGCRYSGGIGANSDLTVPVSAGTHVLDLSGIAGNCELSGSSSRSVDANATGDVPFVITCFPFGNVRVTTATSGIDVDPDGYTICVDRFGDGCYWQAHAQPNDMVTIPGVTARLHTVKITGVAGNCTVSGAAAQAVTVSPVSPVDVTFSAGCIQAERLAFSSGGTILVIQMDPSVTQGITTGFAPAWSPGGTRLAYECGHDICAINADGTGFEQLTFGAVGNHHPTWSPDGLKIGFAATNGGAADLYVMAPNGSGVVRLTQGVGFVGNPAWSPDGTKIAFDCRVVAGNDDICVVNADGSGLARLTNDAARDFGPAWKPDGSTLAFATTRYGGAEIALLNVASGSVTRIGAGLSGFAPTWSPDGTKIAFVETFTCGFYDYYCGSGSYDVVFVARSDGSNAAYLTDGDQPAWRPHP